MSRRWPTWTIDLSGAGVSGLLLAAAYLGGYAPWARTQRAQAVQRAVLAERETDIREREDRLRTLAKETAAAREALRGEVALQSVSEQARRVSALSRLAADTGLTVAGLAPREPKPAGVYAVVPITISGTATPDAIAAFLGALHATFRDTAVASFDVSADPAHPEQPAQFAFELLWHALPGGESVGAGPAGRAGAGAGNPSGTP
jgi:hypothetical protein